MYTFSELNNIMREKLVYAYDRCFVKYKFFSCPYSWVLVVEDLGNSTLGVCRFRTKEIVINTYHMKHSTKEEVLKTLIHEICHAIVGVEVSRGGRRIAHGTSWKNMMCYFGYHNVTAKTEAQNLKHPSDNKLPKYYVVLNDNGSFKKVSECGRKLKNLKDRYLSGKPETTGKLYLVCPKVYQTGCANTIARNVIR